MALINCPECKSEVSSMADVCPRCGFGLKKYREKTKPLGPLILKTIGGFFAVIFLLAIIGPILNLDDVDSGSSRLSRTPSRSSTSRYQPPPAPQGPQLELLDWHWNHQYGYAIAEGQVKSITSEPLENVEVVVTFTDANGKFITTGEALIEYNPVLPGQTSPFSAMATWNPAMNKASVQFKSLFGGTIPCSKRE